MALLVTGQDLFSGQGRRPIRCTSNANTMAGEGIALNCSDRRVSPGLTEAVRKAGGQRAQKSWACSGRVQGHPRRCQRGPGGAWQQKHRSRNTRPGCGPRSGRLRKGLGWAGSAWLPTTVVRVTDRTRGRGLPPMSWVLSLGRDGCVVVVSSAAGAWPPVHLWEPACQAAQQRCINACGATSTVAPRHHKPGHARLNSGKSST